MSASERKEPFNIDVRFEHREDGGLRAYADSLPGFCISNADPEMVIAEIPAVLEVILSGMMGVRVAVTPMVDVKEMLGLSEPLLPAYLCDRVYMGQTIGSC